MTKSEFLEKLRAALSNDLSGPIIQDNVNYYNQYINDEISKGKSEEEVLRELGDPWVLAQTIIDTAGTAGQSQGNYDYDTARTSDTYQSTERQHVSGSFGGWKLILVLLGIIGILLVIVTVIGGVISLVAPILVPLLAIMFVIRLFRRDR